MTLSVHLVVFPLACVLLAIGPHVMAVTLDIVFDKVSDVDRSICKDQLALSVLSTLRVLTFIKGAIRPCLDPTAMLFVVLPLADVPCAIDVLVNSFTVSFIVCPFTLVDISGGMYKLSLATDLTVFPAAFIVGAVIPMLFSKSVFFTVFPLAIVNRAICIRCALVDAWGSNAAREVSWSIDLINIKLFHDGFIVTLRAAVYAHF